jgi:hypothetical protein
MVSAYPRPQTRTLGGAVLGSWRGPSRMASGQDSRKSARRRSSQRQHSLVRKFAFLASNMPRFMHCLLWEFVANLPFIRSSNGHGRFHARSDKFGRAAGPSSLSQVQTRDRCFDSRAASRRSLLEAVSSVHSMAQAEMGIPSVLPLA